MIVCKALSYPKQLHIRRDRLRMNMLHSIRHARSLYSDSRLKPVTGSVLDPLLDDLPRRRLRLCSKAPLPSPASKKQPERLGRGVAAESVTGLFADALRLNSWVGCKRSCCRLSPFRGRGCFSGCFRSCRYFSSPLLKTLIFSDLKRHEKR